MVDQYVFAKKLAQEKCGKDCDFYPFMVCSLYALLCKYKGHEQQIGDLFLSTAIIFEEGSVEEIIKRNNFNVDTQDLISDDEEHQIYTWGVSNQGYSFIRDKDGKVSFIEEDPFIICSFDCDTMEHFLNTFCHELSHLIKGMNNGHYQEDHEDKHVFVLRTGLAHYVYCYDSSYQNLNMICSFSVLDEAINCIQTSEAIEEILALKEFVQDPEILEFINSLNVDELKIDYGYEVIVKIIRRLWENPSFKSIVEANQVNGPIDPIIQHFNSVMGEEAFEDMCQKVDVLSEIYEKDDPEGYKKAKDSLNQDIDRYLRLMKEKEKKK